MFGIIAKYRAKRTYKKHGYNQMLNPYTPKMDNFWGFTDNWSHWYWAHQGEHYKYTIPNYYPKDYHQTIPDDYYF